MKPIMEILVTSHVMMALCCMAVLRGVVVVECGVVLSHSVYQVCCSHYLC